MIQPERKQFIDDVVEELRGKYDLSCYGGLRQLAQNQGITTIRTNDVIESNAVYFNTRYYIILRDYSSIDNLLASYSHELGHVLLSHLYPFMPPAQAEPEADYFREQLGHRYNIWAAFVDNLPFYFSRPLFSLRWVFSEDFSRKQKMKILQRVGA